MKATYWLAFALLGSIWLGVWLLSGEAAPESLVTKALTGGDATQKSQAAAALSMQNHSRSAEYLRKVVQESPDVEVKIAALNGLVSRGDFASAPLFLDAMENADKTIRQLGLQGMKRTIGFAAPDYHVDDLPEARTKAVKQIREIHQAMLVKAANPGLNDDPSAGPVATQTTATAPLTAAAHPQTATPMASAPTYSASPAVAHELQDFRIVNLVVWSCRALAVLVLGADLLGVICLFRERNDARARAKRHARSKTPLTSEEQLERLATRLGTGLWSKVGMLMGGAVCAVALLWAGEAISLAAQLLGEINHLRVR